MFLLVRARKDFLTSWEDMRINKWLQLKMLPFECHLR